MNEATTNDSPNDQPQLSTNSEKFADAWPDARPSARIPVATGHDAGASIVIADVSEVGVAEETMPEVASIASDPGPRRR